MLYVAAFLAIIFLGIGFLLNSKNARYLLSGYNTLPEEEKKMVDIEAYLKFFRRFHIILAGSTFFGTLILWLVSVNTASIYMIVFPILAYTVFLWKANSFFYRVQKSKVAVYVPIFLLLFVGSLVLFFSLKDLRSSDIEITKTSIEIKGSFGTVMPKDQIDSVALLPEYPGISWKSYGFAAGDFAKGDFRLKDGSSAKMYINKSVRQVIYISNAGKAIYYNSDKLDMDSLYHEILHWRKSNI